MKEKIFGIGLSKTGSTSLTEALKILGYSAYHYPRDIATIEKFDAVQNQVDRVNYQP